MRAAVMQEITHAVIWSILLVAMAIGLATQPAQAQFSGSVSVNGSGPTLAVNAKGAGKADLVFRGVVQRGSDTLYCLTGTKGNWAGVGGGTTRFDTSRMACGKVIDGAVTVPVSVAGYESGLTFGLMPITVKTDGMLVKWEEYPRGSQQFKAKKGLSPIIALRVEKSGQIRLATADEALKDIDD
jgi:hypothetical protein